MYKENKIAKVEQIKLIISDVDGVLTDGSVYIGPEGKEYKQFHIDDVTGSAIARLAGINIILLSGRFSKSTAQFAKELKVIDCIQGKLDKINAYKEILEKYKLKDSEVLYIGDSLIDIPVLERVGYAVSVADAKKEVHEISDYISPIKGGKGVLRDVVLALLNHAGTLENTMLKMKKKIYKSV
tara:strand:- start:221 stop:769 length:549 start_codon:yes stop_codon:yes gene_type:complete